MKKLIKDEIWILGDERPGTVAQGIGLANEIGFDSKIIPLSYSFLAKLPNVFFSSSLLRLKCEAAKNIKKQEYFPRLIISAGRRAAPIALYLKKKSGNKSKVIQIMNPNLDFKKFDLVILPKHDGLDEKDFPNLVTTLGSLSKVNDKIIASEKEKFAPWFRDIKKEKIALLIGGSSKRTEFDEKSGAKLAKHASEVAQNMDATLLILNSRRSSEQLNQAIKENLDCDHRFYDWLETKNNNPYLAVLAEADYFIISGDSVSMISECCSTGKPVYIFDEKNISALKHRKFHQELIKGNYAKKFSGEIFYLEKFSSKRLQETKRIALIIREQILVD